jgi:hypothetical protein
MLGKLSVALLIVASPALADEAAPAAAAPATQEYTIKKVCHTVEVAGSFIPRTSCVNKKVPVKKPAPEPQEAKTESGAPDSATKEQ